MRKYMLLLVLPLLLVPAPARSQEIPMLLPGTKVRVFGGYSDITGFVESARPDTIRLVTNPGSPAIAIARENIVRMELLVPRSKGRGAAVGAKWGALIFGPLLLLDCGLDLDACRYDYLMAPDRSDAATMATAGLVGATSGAMVGALIGAIWPGTRTVDFPLPPRVTVNASRLGVALQVGF